MAHSSRMRNDDLVSDELPMLLREQDESDNYEDDDCAWLLSVVEEQRAKKKPHKQRENVTSLPGLWEVEVLSGM